MLKAMHLVKAVAIQYHNLLNMDMKASILVFLLLDLDMKGLIYILIPVQELLQ